ncbi:flagellar hook-basal body protein [Planococcus salinus]|uniref:Flagellar hook-basal body protein n=1 Tax=Planococcus salinus TaxID=1848460 RepID=A0A3M8P575_9BACL|nr:flagellar hook-basal body protein [Planococcus salinus]RNF38762.1 flagellar hook-basal body protein [Planococcus salinus]
MNIQMNSAATSMRELQKKIDVLAGNVANAGTNGYKRQEANFSDTLVQSIERQAGLRNEIGRTTPNGIRVGSGVKVAQTSLRHEQGSLVQTNRPLDFAIEGSTGYFRVASEGTVFYTRDGSFQVQPVLNSNQLNLVTATGDAVLDSNNQPISFDNDYDQIQVNQNGTMQVTFKDAGKQPAEFQLSVATIDRPNLLEKAGGNRYQLPGTEAQQVASGNLQLLNLAGPDSGAVRIRQGSLEMSNVDMTEEMTELIATQRLIQSQGKAISFADDMMGLVNTIRG